MREREREGRREREGERRKGGVNGWWKEREGGEGKERKGRGDERR